METITFMQWWKSVNAVLRSRGQEALLYGEARGFWNDIERELREELARQ